MSRFRRLIPPVAAFLIALPAVGDQLPPDASYRPLPTQPLATVRAEDEAAKPEVMRQQQQLFEQRFDLSDRPTPGVMMSGGLKPVQAGVRVKLPQGVNWDSLAQMTPDEIRNRGLLPLGFMPLPHVKQATGGQVFPNVEIDEIHRQEDRDLRRFDVDFDIPDRFTPEFPAPIYLMTHPELGDVSADSCSRSKTTIP